jgi:hypothetical protein
MVLSFLWAVGRRDSSGSKATGRDLRGLTRDPDSGFMGMKQRDSSHFVPSDGFDSRTGGFSPEVYSIVAHRKGVLD